MPQQSLPRSEVYSHPEYLRFLKIMAEVREYFYEGKGFKAAVQNSGHRVIEEFLSKHIPVTTPVVDLGCGHGAHYEFVKDPRTVVGLEIDIEALKVIHKKWPAARVIHGDCYKLPFRDGVLPRVISVYNLEHIYYLEALVSG
jgi:SAM-dependent methyltransferase